MISAAEAASTDDHLVAKVLVRAKHQYEPLYTYNATLNKHNHQTHYHDQYNIVKLNLVALWFYDYLNDTSDVHNSKTL